jgi:hypothetical protein
LPLPLLLPSPPLLLPLLPLPLSPSSTNRVTMLISGLR